jgi:hypothetical protein
MAFLPNRSYGNATPLRAGPQRAPRLIGFFNRQRRISRCGHRDGRGRRIPVRLPARFGREERWFREPVSDGYVVDARGRDARRTRLRDEAPTCRAMLEFGLLSCGWASSLSLAGVEAIALVTSPIDVDPAMPGGQGVTRRNGAAHPSQTGAHRIFSSFDCGGAFVCVGQGAKAFARAVIPRVRCRCSMTTSKTCARHQIPGLLPRICDRQARLALSG